MQTVTHAGGERIAGRDGATVVPALLSVDEFAALLCCSKRHIRRLADSGAIPPSIKLGALVRWRAHTGDPATGIDDWIQAGCPDCRKLRPLAPERRQPPVVQAKCPDCRKLREAGR
jgi:excisionase family DNA binding protein